MSSIVNGFSIQKSTKTAYDTQQPCDCWDCSAFTAVVGCGQTDGMDDWEFGETACCFTCPNKKQCAKPDPAECNIGTDSHQRDPLTRVTWNGRGPNVQCVYDVNRINTLEQIDNFKQRFGVHGDYNAVVANYCQQSSDSCITDPETGTKMTKCSRFKSDQKDGELCRGWFNQQPKAVQDTVVQNYCAVNNTPDCKCVNRAQNEVYRELKIGKVINDGCWFTPCANPQSYLLTTEVENPTCPSNFCDIIYNIIKDRDVTIDDVKNDINCVFKPDPPPQPKPQPPPDPPKPPPDPPKPDPPPPPPPKPTPPPDPPKPKPDPVPPPKPTPPPPKPTPPPPIPPQPVPILPIPPVDLKKNWIMLTFVGLVLALVIYPKSRHAIGTHTWRNAAIAVLVGLNAFGLQSYVNNHV
ncbi:hypothetical protein MIV047R [Invertebrate iridescent virus 3]|uniref:Putative membrane protein 047R n=1 Tax=Invertebrate iridescent virus 3 TaxID=345201 RepID=VF337_IIV3|nr:hypothetical protein MIV047R [Invertebrate iridescent virus 3]Q197B3.1 RecName: Full=Putative membrane protein 047R [Invertebrate iridescent virus 3]ABF82077.1 hypothetical protein MIV047R [Invertebrate iridescent virus 3]